MLRDLVDRFAYRYRLWMAERQGDKLGAGQTRPELSPRDEPAWRLIWRFVEMIAGGLVLFTVLHRVATRLFPSLGHGISLIGGFVIVGWCAAALFILGGELLAKFSKHDDSDKSI